MCSRTTFTKPILPRNEMKTAIPPNGVTARCVSRRINRSSDNRAVISRGTGLSVAFDSISLLSQIPGPNLTPNFGFPVKETVTRKGENSPVKRRAKTATSIIVVGRRGPGRGAAEQHAGNVIGAAGVFGRFDQRLAFVLELLVARAVIAQDVFDDRMLDYSVQPVTAKQEERRRPEANHVVVDRQRASHADSHGEHVP